MRNGSDLDSTFDFCERLTSMMDQYKGKMTATLTLMDIEKNPGMTEIKDWMMALAKHQISGMDNIYNIHTFIQSHSYNTFIHRHSLGPLSISSSLESQWEDPPCCAEPRIEPGPALQQADALPTKPRRTI